MNTEIKQDIRYTVILPIELNEKVEIEAVSEKRSKAQQINWILEKYFEEKQITERSTVVEKLS